MFEITKWTNRLSLSNVWRHGGAAVGGDGWRRRQRRHGAGEWDVIPLQTRGRAASSSGDIQPRLPQRVLHHGGGTRRGSDPRLWLAVVLVVVLGTGNGDGERSSARDATVRGYSVCRDAAVIAVIVCWRVILSPYVTTVRVAIATVSMEPVVIGVGGGGMFTWLVIEAVFSPGSRLITRHITRGAVGVPVFKLTGGVWGPGEGGGRGGGGRHIIISFSTAVLYFLPIPASVPGGWGQTALLPSVLSTIVTWQHALTIVTTLLVLVSVMAAISNSAPWRRRDLAILGSVSLVTTGTRREVLFSSFLIGWRWIEGQTRRVSCFLIVVVAMQLSVGDVAQLCGVQFFVVVAMVLGGAGVCGYGVADDGFDALLLLGDAASGTAAAAFRNNWNHAAKKKHKLSNHAG